MERKTEQVVTRNLEANLPTDNLDEMEFIAFDLETTGLNPIVSRIVEIGALRFRADGTIIDQFEQLVDPQCPIPPEVTRIHGITDQMVAGKPTIEEVLPQFIEFIGEPNALMLAHNAGFDMSFLAMAIRRLGMPTPEHPVLDTVKLSRRRQELKNHKLETIGRHLDLIDAEEHRAMADTILLKDVFLYLLQNPFPIPDKDELFQLAPPLYFEQFAKVLDNPPSGHEPLWEAIAQQQALIIVYSGGSNPDQARTITPKSVAMSRGKVYLYAYCHQDEMEKTFRLDRIVSYRRSGN